MTAITIRPPEPADRAAVLALAGRLSAFGPTSRAPAEISRRERRALEDAFDGRASGCDLLVAVHQQLALVGVVLLETRRDYFTEEPYGHVGILAVASHAEGQGVGRALLEAAEKWGRGHGFQRLTLTVFAENHRAKAVYARCGWQVELETHYKELPPGPE